jgi:cellulose biosynthesis protein BcsQ
LTKVISVISIYSGCGQTTVVVNLASGLALKGYRVLIGYLGHSEKLNNWLGISDKQEQTIDKNDIINNIQTTILHSPLGIDMVKLDIRPGNSSGPFVSLPALEKLDYDYLLLHPGHKEDCMLLKTISDSVIVCTSLSHANELEELQTLEEYLRDSAGKANSIDLILPNKIDTKEWEHNSYQLFALADYFGYEKIADPIPA